MRLPLRFSSIKDLFHFSTPDYTKKIIPCGFAGSEKLFFDSSVQYKIKGISVIQTLNQIFTIGGFLPIRGVL